MKTEMIVAHNPMGYLCSLTWTFKVVFMVPRGFQVITNTVHEELS